MASTKNSTAVTSKGRDAVRAALTPQFDGVFGDMKFIDEDLMIDAETGKVMASWRCTLDVKGEATSWRGLDAMTFNARRQDHPQADLRENQSAALSSKANA